MNNRITEIPVKIEGLMSAFLALRWRLYMFLLNSLICVISFLSIFLDLNQVRYLTVVLREAYT
jgi:hypothetical protein